MTAERNRNKLAAHDRDRLRQLADSLDCLTVEDLHTGMLGEGVITAYGLWGSGAGFHGRNCRAWRATAPVRQLVLDPAAGYKSESVLCELIIEP